MSLFSNGSNDECKIFEVRYYDDLNDKLGTPVKIKATSFQDVFEEARYRAFKRIGYSVGSIVRIG